MALEDLLTRKCVACEGGVPPLDQKKTKEYLAQVTGWEAREKKLHKTFAFRDFKEAFGFLVQVAFVAETEGHHPDFAVQWNKVDFTIWTHAIGGLSENDFILAAKIDALLQR